MLYLAAKVSTTFNRASWNVDESSNDPAASDDIMNNPYFSAETKQITASPDLFKDSDYYPSENDQVFKLHLNTNFAFGPSIGMFQTYSIFRLIRIETAFRDWSF